MGPTLKEIYSANLLRLMAGLILVVCLGGCGIFLIINRSPVPIPQDDWKTLTGQVLYRDAKRSFVGDVTIRASADGQNYSMQVTKAGAALLKLDRQKDIGWARGPAAVLPFSGKIVAAPAHLQSWFLATDDAVATRSQKVRKPAGVRTNPAANTEIKFRLEP